MNHIQIEKLTWTISFYERINTLYINKTLPLVPLSSTLTYMYIRIHTDTLQVVTINPTRAPIVHMAGCVRV